MKYTATLNGKQYEVELERIDAYEPMPRYGEAPAAAPAAPAAPAPAPAPAAPAPAPAAPAAAPAAGATTVEAPMPGKILNIKVSAGQAVKFGETVIVMEAMKMETEIVAPADGTVAQILVKAGDAVDTGAALVTLN
ncbi:acetyl-CoA carboxylase biotin carboxyl carrier protein subunit [uncultured Clostridium sp.]|uniref:acetyl-CoA carboxylase biotin carboxyl carrier protein subunit n=1 Tax=Clostridium fessum TaxID=2126740 RepID=UPI00266C7AE9|nr:acetyl-CoA carboxylase biotin carboxyl carrier protein subunit [uncultured Clostridium sp.]